MVTVLAVVLIGIFALLASIHVYWALGGGVAKVAAIPELRGTPMFVPGRIATFAVACGLLACAALVGAVTGFLQVPVPAIVIRWGCFALALMLLLRAIGDFRLVGFFKSVRGTRFAWLDSALYSPLCVALGLGVFFVAWKAA